MSEPRSDDTGLVQRLPLPGVFRFAHTAMAASFEILIAGHERRYAAQAAQAAFEELDRLERELSRYVENGDIARLNGEGAGSPLVLRPDAFECLELAARISTETAGAFDVTVATLLACWSDAAPSEQALAEARRATGMHLFELDSCRRTVSKRIGAVRVDLGGIGKGYAVDRMAALLGEWDVTQVVLNGGRSSLLAVGSPPGRRGWPLTIPHPKQPGSRLAHLEPAGGALGASGLRKGRHIIDPRTARPADHNVAAWASAPTAARADALSTAFMVLAPEETRAYCAAHPETGAILVTRGEGERILRFGHLESAGTQVSFGTETDTQGAAAPDRRRGWGPPRAASAKKKGQTP